MKPSACVMILLAPLFTNARASLNEISFDSRPAFACRDVAIASQDGTRVVEAIIKISANFGETQEATMDYVRYDLSFPVGVTVEDHLPKTELNHDILSQEVTQSESSRSDVTISFEAGGSASYGIASGNVRGVAGKQGGTGTGSSANVKFMPPKKVVTAAGTSNRGQTLYWKLKPMSQITLEGERQFVALLRVDSGWKHSVVPLRCTLRMVNGDEKVQQMQLGLYMETQPDARREVLSKANSLIETEVRLRQDTSQRTSVATDLAKQYQQHQKGADYRIERDKRQSTSLVQKPNGAEGITNAIGAEDLYGKWRWTTYNYVILFDLKGDGTFVAKQQQKAAGLTDLASFADGKGTWDFNAGRLSVRMTHVGKALFWKEHRVHWIDDARVLSFTDGELQIENEMPLVRSK